MTNASRNNRVLRLFAGGKTVSQISRECAVNKGTVSKIVKRDAGKTIREKKKTATTRQLQSFVAVLEELQKKAGPRVGVTLAAASRKWKGKATVWTLRRGFVRCCAFPDGSLNGVPHCLANRIAASRFGVLSLPVFSLVSCKSDCRLALWCVVSPRVFARLWQIGLRLRVVVGCLSP